MSRKYSRVNPNHHHSAIDAAGAAYQGKIDSARQDIQAAEYALAQDWCTVEYRTHWTATLVKAQAKLARLEAE